MKKDYYLLIKQNPKIESFDRDSEKIGEALLCYESPVPGRSFRTQRLMQSEAAYNWVVHVDAEENGLGALLAQLTGLKSSTVEVSKRPFSERYLRELLEPSRQKGLPKTEKELEEYLSDMEDFARTLTRGPDSREKCLRFLVDAGIATEEGDLREEYQ